MPRFIPACTGNASALSPSWPASSVHPRMCGECAVSAITAACRFGSSPHVRGTPCEDDGSVPARRFIPACAGNASRPAAGSRPCAVHPRMRGERPGSPFDRRGEDGSSPHARGTRRVSHRCRADSRFIPACAGNAGPCAGRLRGIAVHPRMRGERISLAIDEEVKVGSSPHARGTLHIVSVDLGGNRFIPACAGNAAHHAHNPSLDSVHPRMRGERGL